MTAPLPAAEDAFAAVVARLLRSVERPNAVGFAPIAGGGNNRVIRVTMPDGPDLVVKSYFVSEHDRRDRLGAEWDFLSFAWARGIRNIPQPLACDRAAGAALYSFVQGRKPSAAQIDASKVEAAAEFVLAINRAPRNASQLRPASEACFSVTEHLATVDRRVERLAVLDPSAPGRAEADRFVAGLLQPAWARIRGRIERAMSTAGIAADEPLRPDEICLSPSDFGFHNALMDTQERLTFIDFEYAGRDDPAKLICDFFCQPELPVPLSHYEYFAGRVLDGLTLSARHAGRCRSLLDAYRIKWICIILNDFLPVGAARRAFAEAGVRAERCAAQLAKAREKLAQIS